ncbi:MAG: RNA polymerase sigma factor, partial [Gaiellaceae bacterium]
MKRPWRRSGDMQGVLTAPASDMPTDAEAAFEELYRSSRDDVFAYVAGLLRDRSAAEDVTAQAFERAYRRRSSFDPRRGSRRAWLFGIARNAALDELRRRGHDAIPHGALDDAERDDWAWASEAAARDVSE